MTDESVDEPTPVNATEADPERRSKVGRIIAERTLEGMGEELERRWTGEGREQSSLRELADYFNQRVLRETLDAQNVEVLDGEVENFYELLTGDDVSGGMRVQTERRLERDGIDVDRLKNDFVSHQAIHTYLRKYRGAEATSNDSEDKVEETRTTIQQLRSRVQAVTETSLDALRTANELRIGRFDVYVDVRVTCNDCQSQYSVGDLLDRGRCQCE
ncbi:rod-determining factor RdfA [Halorussus halophilus]|uniref:rod-determining factor RdfA n=1 Tax=Halorussus halophilus TaxID=2650975 RepID=UPI0013014946|nr:rod-determining factor RdfA [Halorussus halophilus]